MGVFEATRMPRRLRAWWSGGVRVCTVCSSAVCAREPTPTQLLMMMDERHN